MKFIIVSKNVNKNILIYLVHRMEKGRLREFLSYEDDDDDGDGDGDVMAYCYQ